MAPVISSHVQQKRKIDFGFEEEAMKVKKIRIRYTPSLIPPLLFNTKDLSYNNHESQKPVIRRIRIKCTPSVSKELSYNQKENKRLIQLSRMLGNIYRRSFFTKQKLCLVLDLDHTLLHSVRIQDVSAEEQQYLNLQVSSMKDMDGNNLYKHVGRYTKLRPYTREFLKEVSDSFELFIYTMGTRDYAKEMGRILDPSGVIFKSRIVSRDDSTKDNRKNLDVLAGPNEKNTIIIDDTKHVWEENEKNLIKIDKYNYFTESGHKLKKDDEEDGALESISEVLNCVHKIFFESFLVPSTDFEVREYVNSADVRPVLKASLKLLRVE
ncbi:hypothetical protein MKX01_000029 [Papaver californicum]|nr:hypothetical protein MKX01_000029 [Papaver californicum]